MSTPSMPPCHWCEHPALPAQYVTPHDGAACSYHRQQLVDAAERRLWVSGRRRIRDAVDALLRAGDIRSRSVIS